MKVVTADGELVKAGGKVVKNVAGYDLCKLFTGSQGTLGLIVELTFKLRPLPNAAATLATYGPGDNLLKLARLYLDEPLFPASLELLSAGAARAIGLESRDPDCLLLTRFNGSRSTVAYQMVRASALARCELSNSEMEVHEEDQALWQHLQRLVVPQEVGRQTTIRPAEISKFVESLSRLDSIWHAGVATGRFRGFGSYGAGNGKFSNSESPAYKTSRLQLMTRIKQQLDPDGVFPFLESNQFARAVGEG